MGRKRRIHSRRAHRRRIHGAPGPQSPQTVTAQAFLDLASLLDRVAVELDSHPEAAIPARRLAFFAREGVVDPSRRQFVLNGTKSLVSYARRWLRDAMVTALVRQVEAVEERMPPRSPRKVTVRRR